MIFLTNQLFDRDPFCKVIPAHPTPSFVQCGALWPLGLSFLEGTDNNGSVSLSVFEFDVNPNTHLKIGQWFRGGLNVLCQKHGTSELDLFNIVQSCNQVMEHIKPSWSLNPTYPCQHLPIQSVLVRTKAILGDTQVKWTSGGQTPVYITARKLSLPKPHVLLWY